VFLFDRNDNRVLDCIVKEKKLEGYEEFYRSLGIQEISETKDKVKLIDQLKRMKNIQISGYHKDIYKQIISQLSKIEDTTQDVIPVLYKTHEGNYNYKDDEESVWFAPREFKKYKHQFPEKLFVHFDEETKQEWVKSIKGINIFNPQYRIGYDEKQFRDDDLKEWFQREHLAQMLAMAEERLGSRFNKEEALLRWQNLIIYKANNVYMYTSEAKVEKREETTNNSNKDVLYIPVSNKSSADKTLVGELAHDLCVEKVKSYENQYYTRFGHAFAHAIFHNQTLGALFTEYFYKCYIQNNIDEAKDDTIVSNYLLENGVSDVEIKECQQLIEISLLSKEEIIELVTILKEYSSQVNENNWRNISVYNIGGKSFDTLQKEVVNNKLKTIVEAINPRSYNVSRLKDLRSELELCHFFQNKTELSDDLFYRLLDNKEFEKKSYYFALSDEDLINSIGYEVLTKEARIDTEYNLEIYRIQKQNDIKIGDSFAPIKVGDRVKAHSVSSGGNDYVHVRRVSQEDRNKEHLKRSRRGIGAEELFCLKNANDINSKGQIGEVKKCIHGLGIQELDKYIEDVEVNHKALKEVLWVSKNVGDGLGYDVLEPVFENNKLINFNKVELKYSTGEASIHISEPERQKILAFTKSEDKNWKLYHIYDKKVIDRTEGVKSAVLKHSDFYNGEHQIVAESWVISFDS
jgi:hypothetical protein